MRDNLGFPSGCTILKGVSGRGDLVVNRRHTDVFSLCRRSSNPVNSAIDAVPKSEGVIILAVDGAPHTFDGRNC